MRDKSDIEIYSEYFTFHL